MRAMMRRGGEGASRLIALGTDKDLGVVTGVASKDEKRLNVYRIIAVLKGLHICCPADIAILEACKPGAITRRTSEDIQELIVFR